MWNKFHRFTVSVCVFFLFLQHPQIQKKSQYIKYLCCDDVRTLHQWVNGIRIAKVGNKQKPCKEAEIQPARNRSKLFQPKFCSLILILCSRVRLFDVQYGKQLYVNYQEAMKRTEAAYDWSSLSTSSIRSGSSSASIPGMLIASSGWASAWLWKHLTF